MMKSLIFEKEYTQLTRKELSREMRLQLWLLRMMRSFKGIAYYHAEKQRLRGVPRDGLAEEYINGIITAEEYAKERRKNGTHTYQMQMWLDRGEYCEKMQALLEGETAKIADIMASGDEKKPKMGRPKKKKEYTRGYDPRKNVSKNNYIGKK